MDLMAALVLAGISVGLGVGWGGERATRLRRAPQAARHLPRYLRPCLAVLVFYLRPWITRAAQLRKTQQLRQAGMVGVSAEDLIALQAGSALVGGVLSGLLWTLWQEGGHIQWTAGVVVLGAVLAWVFPSHYLLKKAQERARAVMRDLPFMLDLLCLCMEAGLNLMSGLQHYAKQGPEGVLKEEVLQVLAEVRTGQSRSEALQAWSARVRAPALAVLLAQLTQAEQQGLSLLMILQTQADQQRQQRMLQLEKQAMEAPVKLLLPLVLFIFPCTFLILGFPLVMQGLEALP